MPSNGKTVGGTSGVAIGVILVWLAGHFGINMSAEVGAVIGGIAITFGAAVCEMGLIGIISMIFIGRKKEENV